MTSTLLKLVLQSDHVYPEDDGGEAFREDKRKVIEEALYFVLESGPI